MGIIFTKLSERSPRFKRIVPYLSMIMEIFWYVLILILILNVRELMIQDFNAYLEDKVCFYKNDSMFESFYDDMNFNFSNIGAIYNSTEMGIST